MPLSNIPPLKRKEPDSGSVNDATASKRNRGPVETSEAPVPKQISPALVVTASSEDPLANSLDSQRSSTIPRSMMAASPDIFPRFSAGTVTIKLCNELKGHYQLHRAVLVRNSTWFARELKKDEAVRVSGNFCFTLTRTPGLPISVLQKMVIAMPSNKSVYTLTAIENLSPQSDCQAQPQPQRMPVDRRTSKATIVDLASTDDVEPEVLLEPGAGAKVEVANAPMVKIKQEPQENLSLLKLAPEAQQPKAAAPSAPISPADADAVAKQQEFYQQYAEAYSSLLSMFYNIAPNVSTSDVNCALNQCEKIVKLANIYGSLPTIRPYLGNVLSQFRQKLYAAIEKDPPRWLLLGVALESASIFCEAMIHCAGSFPCPWKTRCSTLPPNVLGIIQKKAKWLARLRSEVNQELFVNSICEADGGPSVSIKSSPESWIVVQIFRDWLALQIQQNRKAGTIHYGNLYHMMARGGNAYLPTAEIKNLLEDASVSGKLIDETWDEVEGDLKMIKSFAKEAVAQLVVNNLLIDPVSLGIPYLTCVEVGDKDFPWRSD